MQATFTQQGLFGTSVQLKKSPKAIAAEKLERKVSKDSNGKTIFMLGETHRIVKFKPNVLTAVNVYKSISPNTRAHNPHRSDNLMKDGQVYNGYLSPATTRQIKQMLSVWLTAVEMNNDLKKQKKEVNAEQVLPTFVTLTLPHVQLHSDNQIKHRLLNPFVKWLQEDCGVYQNGKRKGQLKGFGVKGYFWRAEAQKNGRVHFHILVDRYIPWDRIREKWNKLCYNLGYIDRYRHSRNWYYRHYEAGTAPFPINKKRLAKDMEALQGIMKVVVKERKIPYNVHPVFASYLESCVQYGEELFPTMIRAAAIEKQKVAYEEGKANNWSNPNSTDIHSVQNLDSITAYVVKYVTKKPTEKQLPSNQKIEFRREFFNHDMLVTYEEVLNEETGEMELGEEIDLQYYYPEFQERRVEGRIWGCADILRGQKLKEGEKVVETKEGKQYKVFEDEELAQAQNPKPFYSLKYFTRVSEISEKWAHPFKPGDDMIPWDTPLEVVNPQVDSYIKLVTSKVGQKKVETLSNSVGDFFTKCQGLVVPLDTDKLGWKPKKNRKGEERRRVVPHHTILKRFAPEIAKEYEQYHQNIYNCIYGQAAA